MTAIEYVLVLTIGVGLLYDLLIGSNKRMYWLIFVKLHITNKLF